jgi:hypothetical protein
MNAWSHLPNAEYIDRIIASAKSHPDVWDAAWDEARHAARYKAWNAAWNAIRYEDRYAAMDASGGPVLALIAYDAAAKYLEMDSEKLKVWAALSEEPAAVLMLSAVIAFERIKEEQLSCT